MKNIKNSVTKLILILTFLIIKSSDLLSCHFFGSETVNDRLMEAAKNNNLEAVQKALSEGADVNAQGLYGETALIEAARKGNVAIAEKLLEAGADINTESYEGFTAYGEALAKKKEEMLKFLRAWDANIRANKKLKLKEILKQTKVAETIPGIQDIIADYWEDEPPLK